MKVWAWIGLGVALSGCAKRARPPAVDPAIAPIIAQLEGEWVVSLTDADDRRLKVLQLSQQSTIPGEPELRAMGLEEEDLALLDELRSLPLDDPQREAIADTVARMSGRSLIISPQTMILSAGPRSREVRWSLVEQQDELLIISFQEDDGSETTGRIRFGAEDTLIFIDSQGEKLIFERAD